MIPGLLDAITKPEIEIFNRSVNSMPVDPTFIPVHLTGGIGDVIISLDNIRWLHNNFKIVVYCHHIEAFKYFCPDIPCFKDRPEYTWTLEFNTIAKFHTTDHFGGFLIKEHENLFLKQRDTLFKNPRLEAIVKKEFNRFFLISNYAKEHNLSRTVFPMHTLGINEKINYNFHMGSLRQNIITIHDGYDVHNKYMVSGRATKQWKWEHWNKLVKDIKFKYPEHKIIQLGAVTGRPIDGVDDCLLNKTTIVEALNILSQSSLHIDGDSGLVHAATRFGIPSIVMWGPTPMHFYAYPQNINLTSNVCNDACYGVKENWMDKCPINYTTPKCMDEILPEHVLERIQL